ncbi:MAG: helicase-related protein [Desulfuromonadales bacterium]
MLAELYGEGFDEWLLQHNPKQAIDEFELESDKAEEEHDDEESLDGNVIPAGRTPVLITNREKSDRTETFDLLRSSRKRVEQTTETLRLIYGDKEFGCLDCNSRDTLKNKVFQSARVGAPFLLGNSLPTLLEFAPDGIKPAEHPYRGRRLLTFNDSRQGTARIAARLQQESERNRVRGLVYHLVLKHHLQQTTQETETARNLKAELNTPGLPESTRRLLEGLLAKEAARYQALGFNALAGQLTSQGLDFSRMLGTYRNFDPEIFGGSSGPLALAKMLLIREFARRPKRSNNLETMGLVAVCYPALDKVVLPGAAKRAGFTLDDWRDFLKICLDFFVRSGGSLEIDRSWRSWLGMPFRQTSLVTRDTEAGRFQRRWPRARRSAAQSTLVRLLAYVLKADIETACSEDHVDDLLSAAWDELTSRDILQLSAGGRLLPTNEMAFKPVETAWICPVTRRILDTTLKGGTPYLPRTAIAATAQCEKTTIPLYDVAFGGEDDELRRIRRARSWIGQQSDLIPLREGGIWTNLNDRVVELAPYFTTAEHSAQQGSALLDGYEKAFKTGDLNLLSCSTTMEMGIDIGGISMVAMNNVPPHPANYLQRAGRAGRRQETRSVAFTLCKANPHDQAVFRNSRWAFDTPLPAPKVSLESKVIVQRHVNSMLLAHFLSQVVDGRQDKTKLTCGWFLADKVDSKAEHYSKWCRNFDPKISPVLVEGLDQLVRHSVYEGHSLTALFQQSAEGVEQIKKAWLGEWDELCRQEKHVSPTGESSPAYKAIQNHKKRMGDEYLLRELATQGFLPGYGFPTHIVTFDNMEISKFKRQLKEKEGREDNRYRRRELPSRDRVTALREYAPGAELVIDGLVYRSAGITLNWHVPASEKEINEIQNIKIAWQCQRCGASGSTRLMQSIQACSACRQPIDSFLEFLEPAGFSVDFYEDIDNDVSTQDFIPVELPWINAQGEWIDLPHPALGRYRATTEGHIFHQSRGLFGKGYAICLACGRSEPLTQDDKPKLLIQPHKRLRGSNKAEDCPGSHEPWKIKQVNALGHEEKTDVLEIQLRDENGLWLTNSRVANTLAVAFRDALAEQLGVQVSELGCGIKQTELADQSICKSIFLYDRFAAGYSSSLAIDSKPGEDGDSIAQLIINAAKKLDCPADCDSVCPQCLLDFDQRFIAEQLDRKTAKQLLNEAWISELQGSR